MNYCEANNQSSEKIVPLGTHHNTDSNKKTGNKRLSSHHENENYTVHWKRLASTYTVSCTHYAMYQGNVASLNLHVSKTYS